MVPEERRRRIARLVREAGSVTIASLESEAQLLQRVDALKVERSRVVAALLEQGWRLPSPQGNFYWLPLGDDSDSFAAACGDAGVSVRPFPGDGVRVTIGEPEANDLLLAAAEKWLREHG